MLSGVKLSLGRGRQRVFLIMADLRYPTFTLWDFASAVFQIQPWKLSPSLEIAKADDDCGRTIVRVFFFRPCDL